jgi:hypothetical protein
LFGAFWAGGSEDVVRFRYGVAVVAAGMIAGLASAAGSAASLALPHRAADRAAAGALGGAADSSPVAVSPDGSAVFVNGRGLAAPDQLVAYHAATGAKVWAASPPVGGPIAVSPGGSAVFGTGTIRESGNTMQYTTYAYNAATGARLWLATYDVPSANGADIGDSIAVSPDGSRVFITGGSESVYATVAYNAATGARLWVASYSNGFGALSVAVSPDGSRVFVTGDGMGANGQEDFATVAYQAATGTMSWAAGYQLSAKHFAAVTDVAVSPDGSMVYAAGQVHTSTNRVAYGVVAYDAATGTLRWARHADLGGDLLNMIVGPNGSGVFVTGQDKTKAGTVAYATLALNPATGARLWGNQWPRRWPLGLPFNMAVSPDGSKVFITGAVQITNTGPTNTVKYGTVAYDAVSGRQLWATVHGPANGNSQAFGVAVSPNGSTVFVGGNHGTVAYKAATGAQLWTAH